MSARKSWDRKWPPKAKRENPTHDAAGRERLRQRSDTARGIRAWQVVGQVRVEMISFSGRGHGRVIHDQNHIFLARDNYLMFTSYASQALEYRKLVSDHVVRGVGRGGDIIDEI